jgi:hypothetical protein
MDFLIGLGAGGEGEKREHQNVKRAYHSELL